MSLKILHVTSNRDGNIGGAEKLLLDLHGRFDAREFKFSYANVLSLGNSDDPYIAALRSAGLEHANITGLRLASMPMVFARLRRLMRSGDFDVVHTHLLHGSLIGQAAARSLRRPARVLTRHFTNDVFRGSRLLKELDPRSMRMAERVVAVSEAVKREALEQGICEKKVRVIHNGVDLEQFDRVLKERPIDQNRSSFRLVTVGSLTKRKGHEYLIAAMSEVVRKHPDVDLVIVGDGPERETLESLADNLGLRKHIEFAGFRKDVAELVRDSDVYVHSAVYEPFGIALTEAMALRKCVIAADTGGVPEIVVDGKTGVLVETGNAGSLAEGIMWAYGHRAETERMADAGRRRVEELFELGRTAESYADMYRELRKN